MPKDLTPKQAAALLSVDISTLYKWLHSGALPAKRLNGTRWRIREEDALGMLQPHRPPEGLRPAREASAAQRAAEEELRRAGIG